MCLNKHNYLVNIKYKINIEPDTKLNLRLPFTTKI